MTIMPHPHPDYEASPDAECVPLRHGLTAVIVRYRDDEDRPDRPTHLLPNGTRQQAEYAKWQARHPYRTAEGGAA